MNMEKRPAKAEDNAAPYLQQFREKSRGTDEPFFSTPELRQRLDLLRHLTDNSEKVLLVKGVVGAGKSTLLEQFVKQSRDEWDLCSIDASHTFHPDQFFSHLYRRYGLTDEASLTIEHLIKRFELLIAAGRKAVIVIDDAQLLPVATMIAIFRLFERRPGNRALIRVVLFATPDIINLFQMPQLQAMNLQSVQSLEMPLLDSRQSESFVQFLLDLWNGSGHLKLSGGSLNRLLRESNGLPGQLETQLKHLFSKAPEQQKISANETPDKVAAVGKGLFSDLPKPVLAGIALLGVLLLLTLIFQNEINSVFIDTDQAIEGGSTEPLDGSTAKPLTLPLQTPAKDDATQQAEQGVVEKIDLPIDEEVGEANFVELPVIAEQGTGSKQESIFTASQDGMPAPDLAATKDTAISTQAEEVQRSESDLASVQLEPQVSLDDKGENSRIMADTKAIETPESPVLAAPLSPSPKSKPLITKSPEEKSIQTTKTNNIRREEWLLAQSPGAYTLQLVGVRDELAAKRFIEQYRLTADAAYFKTMRSGVAWYSVLYGHFPDRAAAIKARSALPIALRKSDVWPRTFASVQAALKK